MSANPVNVQPDCARCMYMLAQQHPQNIGEKIMSCRRFPPQLVPMIRPGAQGTTQVVTPMFPVITAGVWCFEFRPRVDEPPKGN
jgi:hypothetical protein